MTEYKPSAKSIFLNLFFVVIFLIIVLLLKNSNLKVAFWTIFIVIIAYFFFQLIEKKVHSIKINSDNITINSSQYIFFKSDISINGNDLLISYKREFGPRGIKIFVFKIYEKDKSLVVSITEGYNGWSKETLSNLSMDLQKIGATLIEEKIA